MKSALQGIRSRVDEAEDQTNNIEDKKEGNT